MIEEIKKELLNCDVEILYGKFGEEYKYLKHSDVVKLLDKYNNQEKQTAIFIDNEDMEERYGTQLYIEYLEKYKNAWNELKEGIEINMDYYDSSKFKEFVSLNDIEELEQKYNLGGE